jgi:hypothetical protein
MHPIFVNGVGPKTRLIFLPPRDFCSYPHFQNSHAFTKFLIERKKSMTIKIFLKPQKRKKINSLFLKMGVSPKVSC